MTTREVELLAIGAGPSNLALAVALEELAPALARRCLVLEKDQQVSWQRGMLLPEAQSQVSFLKDLVTMRNPRSRFSFLNYLHVIGRLDQFVNMGSFVPYRVELAAYLKWVSEQLSAVQVELGAECVGVSPVRDADRTLTGWRARMADGSTIGSRYLVIGTGRDTRVPEALKALPAERLVHSTEYLQRIALLDKDRPWRVAVIGAGQSSAELFLAVQSDLPQSRPTLVMRSIGMNMYESSKFNNELFYGSFVDKFFEARHEARRQMLAMMRHTNYAGLAPDTMETLYRQFYLDRFNGRHRLALLPMHDIASSRTDGDEVVLNLVDWRTGAAEELRCDLVLLGTGFSPEMPWMVRELAAELGLEQIEVSRHYRLRVEGPATGACYLQGVNEATHGIADSLLSVLAPRSAEIVQDVLAHRAAHPLPAVPHGRTAAEPEHRVPASA